MKTQKVAVILAGGKGRRLQPFTTIIPKPLFPVGEKPIIQIIIENLRLSGFNRFIISLGYLGELIEAFLGDGKKFECKIEYIRELSPLGTAGPLSCLPDLETDFLYMNGDILTTMDFRTAYDNHCRKQSLMTLCTYRKVEKSSLGVLELDKSGIVTNYLEKPETAYWISSGIYIINPAILKYIKKHEKIDLPDLVMRLIKKKETVQTYNIEGDWFDIGTPGDLELAEKYFKENQR